MTICFLVPHREKRENDDNPVEDVCDDRAICRGILPAEQSIEDAPSTAAIDLGITALCLVSNTIEKSFHEERGPTLTCQTLWRISYEPGPEPVSEAFPPMSRPHCDDVREIVRLASVIYWPYSSRRTKQLWRRGLQRPGKGSTSKR